MATSLVVAARPRERGLKPERGGALVGVAVYTLYRPHGFVVAGAVVIAVGADDLGTGSR